MANKKTLFIVGAGASTEANLPDGYKLKQEIADLLNIRFNGYTQESGDYDVCEAIRIHCREKGENAINPYFHAARHICEAMPQAISIDNFIDTHSNNNKIELCGKLAIVRAILEAEKQSLLYFDTSNTHNRLNFQALEETWYTNFTKLLTENCRKENLSDRLKSIAFVVFNYDRCLEHFIYNSLQNYYGIKSEEASPLVNQIEIYHPYGVVGYLPWQLDHLKDPSVIFSAPLDVIDGTFRKDYSVLFGTQLNADRLLKVSKQIKTFTESIDKESSNILAMRSCVANADNIIFLGFAYHRLNMKLLMAGADDINQSKVYHCFGTAMGISDADCEGIRSELTGFYKSSNLSIHNDLTCYQLFKEHWRSISLV